MKFTELAGIVLALAALNKAFPLEAAHDLGMPCACM
jgi:hypothetical protein